MKQARNAPVSWKQFFIVKDYKLRKKIHAKLGKR